MMRKIEREPMGLGWFVPGQDLVVAGAIGKIGVRAALEKKRDLLSARFSPLFMEKIEEALTETLALTSEKLEALGASEWEPVEEGGILTALWNISGAYGRGITFSLLDIPVRQELIEVCELLDLNPYRLWSGECVVMVTDHGQDLVRRLKEMGIRASVIGKVERGIARTMTGVGTTGYLERPQPDEMYKICNEDKA